MVNQLSKENPHYLDTDIESGTDQKPYPLQSVQFESDPNVVDWDGDGDPEKALNWPTRKKYTYIILLSTLTLLSFVVLLLFNSKQVALIPPSALLAPRCLLPVSH